MGESGAGQSAKLINQLLVANQFMLIAEACALAERAGIDPELMPDALAGGRADSAISQEYMVKMARSDFWVSGTIGQIDKDLEMVRVLAREHGAYTPIISLVREFYRKLLSSRPPDADTAEVIRLYRDE